jgi:hypothetical protein
MAENSPGDPDFGHRVLAKALSDVAEDYVARGRKFQHVSLEELQQRFIEGVDLWANTPERFDGRLDFRDVIAEFRLRGISEPLELVRPQSCRITEHNKARTRGWSQEVQDDNNPKGETGFATESSIRDENRANPSRPLNLQ